MGHYSVVMGKYGSSEALFIENKNLTITDSSSEGVHANDEVHFSLL